MVAGLREQVGQFSADDVGEQVLNLPQRPCCSGVSNRARARCCSSWTWRNSGRLKRTRRLHLVARLAQRRLLEDCARPGKVVY